MRARLNQDDIIDFEEKSMKRIVSALAGVAGLLLSSAAASAHEEGPASTTHLFLMHPFDVIDPLLLVALIAIGAACAWAAWRATR